MKWKNTQNVTLFNARCFLIEVIRSKRSLLSRQFSRVVYFLQNNVNVSPNNINALFFMCTKIYRNYKIASRAKLISLQTDNILKSVNVNICTIFRNIFGTVELLLFFACRKLGLFNIWASYYRITFSFKFCTLTCPWRVLKRGLL